MGCVRSGHIVARPNQIRAVVKLDATPIGIGELLPVRDFKGERLVGG